MQKVWIFSIHLASASHITQLFLSKSFQDVALLQICMVFERSSKQDVTFLSSQTKEIDNLCITFHQCNGALKCWTPWTISNQNKRWIDMKFNYWFFRQVGACDTYLKEEKRKLLMNFSADFVICCGRRLFIMYVSVECKLGFNNLSFRHLFFDIHRWHDFTGRFVALLTMSSAHRWAYFDNFSSAAHKKHNRTPPPRKHSRKRRSNVKRFPFDCFNCKWQRQRHDFWSSASKRRQNRSWETLLAKITFFSDKFQADIAGKTNAISELQLHGKRFTRVSLILSPLDNELMPHNFQSFFLSFTAIYLHSTFHSVFPAFSLYASSRTQHKTLRGVLYFCSIKLALCQFQCFVAEKRKIKMIVILNTTRHKKIKNRCFDTRSSLARSNTENNCWREFRWSCATKVVPETIFQNKEKHEINLQAAICSLWLELYALNAHFCFTFCLFGILSSPA